MLDGTQTLVSQADVAQRERLVLDLQGPSSYTGGGEAILPDQFPFRTGGLLIESADGSAADASAGFAAYDPDSLTDPPAPLLRFYDANGVEVANAVDLSTLLYRLTVWGR